MRTIKRESLEINNEKYLRIEEIVTAYSREKDYFIQKFSSIEKLSEIGKYYEVRNELLRINYNSLNQLQGRVWKLALKDALETQVKYWENLFEKITPYIHKNPNLNEKQRHYCFWIMKDYQKVQKVLLGKRPIPKFDISKKEIYKASKYLARKISRLKGKSPRVKKARSFVLDANCYTTFTAKNTQYISIMTLIAGKRLVIPLKGIGKISGNIRLILNREQKILEIHFAKKIKCDFIQKITEIEAIDLGISEVFTTSTGKRYGKNLGKLSKTYSEQINNKGKSRNKLHSIQKKQLEKGNHKKVKHIKKYNLGKKKLVESREKARLTIEREINQSFNEFFEEVKPKALISENLRHQFKYGSDKKFNRLVSNWVKGTIQDRCEFKAKQRSSLLKQVNAAYGSQNCPNCGFVWKLNRDGDDFKCLFCGHGAKSDVVAAINYLARSSDSTITLWMPHNQVKELLVRRFRRRLECWQYEMSPFQVNWKSISYLFKDWEALQKQVEMAYCRRTVPGRTLDTAQPIVPNHLGDNF